MQALRIAVVGALGAVGQEMIRILQESSLSVKDLIPMDLEIKAGTRVLFRDRDYPVVPAGKGAFKEVDIALFSAGADASRVLAPLAAEEGAVVIDNSSAWRMDETVPLVVPEVNPQDLEAHQGIIANPNCSTIQMVVALKPIHDAFTVRRVVVATYQAVSGSGQAAIEELKLQTEARLKGGKPEPKVYPHPIAFNVLPHIDVFLEDGYTKEELKMVNETHKILDPRIRVTATAARVPVFRGHSEAVNVETEKPFELHEVRTLLEQAPGVAVLDRPEQAVYPLARLAEGRNEVFVGRIRRDPTVANGLNLWIVSDNLRKGAALNAVQIAELLAARGLVRRKR